MSVSMAVVNRTEISELKNVIEINEKVAEIKRYLKGFEGSKFMADRRRSDTDPQRAGHVHRSIEHVDRLYKPLGQILLERKLISGERLDEALTVHWRRGIILGEVLEQMGLIGEVELSKALKEDLKYKG